MSLIVSRVVNHSVKLPSWIMLLAALCAASTLCLATVHEARAQDGPQVLQLRDLPKQLHLPLLSSMIWPAAYMPHRSERGKGTSIRV